MPNPETREPDHDREGHDKHDPHESDEDAVSGMPAGEPELTPMGPDEDERDDARDRGEDAMPGIPNEGEPDVSG